MVTSPYTISPDTIRTMAKDIVSAKLTLQQGKRSNVQPKTPPSATIPSSSTPPLVTPNQKPPVVIQETISQKPLPSSQALKSTPIVTPPTTSTPPSPTPNPLPKKDSLPPSSQKPLPPITPPIPASQPKKTVPPSPSNISTQKPSLGKELPHVQERDLKETATAQPKKRTFMEDLEDLTKTYTQSN